MDDETWQVDDARPPEEHLVRAARAGDLDAWQRLVLAHQQSVFRLALLETGSPDDAADVAQETFLRAFAGLARFDARRALRPWLASITVRQARNHRHASGRYAAMLGRWRRAQPPAPTPEPRLPWTAHNQRLWVAVSTLAPAARQVIWLRFYLDYSQAETAATLGIAAGTVKSRTARALQQLKAWLAGNDPELMMEVRTDE